MVKRKAKDKQQVKFMSSSSIQYMIVTVNMRGLGVLLPPRTFLNSMSPTLILSYSRSPGTEVLEYMETTQSSFLTCEPI